MKSTAHRGYGWMMEWGGGAQSSFSEGQSQINAYPFIFNSIHSSFNICFAFTDPPPLLVLLSGYPQPLYFILILPLPFSHLLLINKTKQNNTLSFRNTLFPSSPNLSKLVNESCFYVLNVLKTNLRKNKKVV